MSINRRLVTFALAGLLLGPAAIAETDRRPDLEGTRALLAKWVETRQVISREERDWQLGKEVLEERISILKRQIESLDGKIAAAKSDLGDVARSERELSQKERSLNRASAILAKRVEGLERSTRVLLGRLPDPLREKLSPLSQRLPTGGAAQQVSLAERYQNVIGILNEVNKFQRNVNLVNEVRDLPSGKTAEVQTVYLGLGQAWYVTRYGIHAGIGRSGPEGWVWTAADDVAPQVTELVEILENRAVPAYVAVPTTMTGGRK